MPQPPSRSPGTEPADRGPLEAEPHERAASATGAARQVTHVRRLRRAAVAGAALLAALLAAVGVGRTRLGRPGTAGDAAAAVAAAPAPSDDVALERVEGTIEWLGPGGWEPLPAGQPLRADDTIRTDAVSRATLAFGDRSRVTVSDATQLTVREITVAAQRLRLSRGRISVDHRPAAALAGSPGERPAGEFIVESAGGESVARAGSARFSVLASGTSLAVATETGVVRLQAAGRAVEVAAGTEAVSFRGLAPEPARVIPAALLLKVARTARGDGVCAIHGSAARGAEVRVEGRLVEVGADGRFSLRLPAREGDTHAAVVTRDAAGRVVERRVACATPAPEHEVSDFAVRWGQGAPGPRAHR